MAHAVIDESIDDSTGRTLLLLEDDPEDVILVKEYLAESRRISSASERWAIEVAGRLSEAVSILEDGSIDLVLADLGLPDSRGLETLHGLREVAPDLPVVIMTGHDDDSKAARAIRAGAQDYVPKYDLTAVGLRRAIAHALERHRLQREVRRRDEMLHRVARVQTIGRLAGGIAHEFNNILTLIKGYAAILERDETLSEEQQGCVREILEAAERTKTITAQLLSFSRRQELRREVIELREVCESALDLMEPLLPRDISIDLVDGDASEVFVDPASLEQSIVHLILNARDSMSDGGRIDVRIGTVSHEDLPDHLNHLDPGPYAYVEVEDEGVGMTEETLENVFDPFFTTKEVGEGPGLGLSQLEGFVDRSDGGVEVRSERGTGTTVRIYLPEAADEAPPEG